MNCTHYHAEAMAPVPAFVPVPSAIVSASGHDGAVARSCFGRCAAGGCCVVCLELTHAVKRELLVLRLS